MMYNMSFLKKEIQEIYKTPRLIIIFSMFLFFAILSPLTARYINEIIASLGQGIDITFPDPTLNDAWIQYFKNTSSLCLIVYLIMMTGTVSQEKSKGSILLVLSKNVSRFNFLFSKLISGVLLYTICYVISFLVSGFYTYFIFGSFFYDGLYISLLLMFLMGVFYTVLAIFVSVISKSPTISALLGFLFFGLLAIINIIPKIAKFNPQGGINLINQMLSGTVSNSSNIIYIISTLIISLILFIITFLIFKKQEV